MLPVPAAPHCPLPPRGFTLERRVDRLPVAAGSSAVVASIGSVAPAHADFGSGRYQGSRIGIPFDVVSKRTRRVRVRFTYAAESDRVRYPIPRHVHIEGGSDRHALLLDRSSCRLYELFALHHGGSGWRAGSGAVWNLRRPRVRPAGWTSADAAGLPILPLLARWDEARRGAIRHALRITVPSSRSAFVFPARHEAGIGDDPALPRMGERLRLKASVETSRLPARRGSSRRRSSATARSSPTTARPGSSSAPPTGTGATTSSTRSGACAGATSRSCACRAADSSETKHLRI